MAKEFVRHMGSASSDPLPYSPRALRHGSGQGGVPVSPLVSQDTDVVLCSKSVSEAGDPRLIMHLFLINRVDF